MRDLHHCLRVLLVLAIAHISAPETLNAGGCKNMQGVDYIDEEKLQGTWYEFARSPRHAEDKSKCNTFIIDLPMQGKRPITRLQVNTVHSERQKKFEGNSTIDGAGKGVATDGFDYTYLETDYDNYLVAYTCENLVLARREVIFILTRQRFPGCETILKSYDAVWAYGLSMDKVKKVDQTDCPENWNVGSGLFDSLKLRG